MLQYLMGMVHCNHICLLLKSQEPKMMHTEQMDFTLNFWPAIDCKPDIAQLVLLFFFQRKKK